MHAEGDDGEIDLDSEFEFYNKGERVATENSGRKPLVYVV